MARGHVCEAWQSYSGWVSRERETLMRSGGGARTCDEIAAAAWRRGGGASESRRVTAK